jgi:predicted DNA-binding protein
MNKSQKMYPTNMDIRVTTYLKEKMHELSKKEGRSVSEIVRGLMMAAVSSPEIIRCYDFTAYQDAFQRVNDRLTKLKALGSKPE